MTAEIAGEPRESITVAKRAGVVAVFTLGSRVLGYARDAVLAHQFGASAVYDAFVVALTIPNLLRRLVAEGSLVIAFVPLLAGEREQGGLQAMRRFTRAVLGLLIPLLFLIAVLAMAFPEATVTMFAAGFEAERMRLAAEMTQVMMPYIIFVSLMALAGGVLNMVGVFAAPAAAPIFLNIAIITFAVFLAERFEQPIVGVAWGVTVGGVLQLAVQLPSLIRAKMFVGPSWEPKHPAVVTLGKRMLPAVFGVAVYQLNLVVIRQIGSFLPDGQLSWYYNATRLQEFALGVFAVSVSVAALPVMSEHAARGDWIKLRHTFRRALRVTNFITVPTTAGLVVLSGPIVGVLFRHGRFSALDAGQTAELLLILGLALVPIGVVRIAVPAFYALGDTRTPVISASASLVATLVLGFALVERYEIHGLTAATSVAAAVQMIVLWGLLRRTLSERSASAPGSETRADPSVVTHAIRCAIASIPACAIGLGVTQARDWYSGANVLNGLVLAAGGSACIASYLWAARLLKIGELDEILTAVKRRLRRKTASGGGSAAGS